MWVKVIILLITIIGTAKCEEYIGIDVYKDPLCSENHLYFKWMMETSQCGNDPLNIDEIGLIVQKIEDVVRYTIYEDVECSGSDTVFEFDFQSCHNITTLSFSGEQFYYKFSDFSTFPLEMTQDTSWLVQSFYLDGNCTNPVVHHNVEYNSPSTYYGGSSVIGSTISDKLFVNNYCISDYIILHAKMIDDSQNYLEVMYLPRNYQKKCFNTTQQYFLQGSQSMPISVSYECLSQLDMNSRYFNQFPYPSTRKYMYVYQSYSTNCQSYYLAYPWKLDYCYSQYTLAGQVSKMMYVSSDEYNVWIVYDDDDGGSPENECKGNQTSFVIANSSTSLEYYDECTEFPKKDVLLDQDPTISVDYVPLFRQIKLSDDPYNPDRIASLLSESQKKCDIDISDLLRKPYGAVLKYYDREFCINNDPDFNEWGLSFRGYCEKGVMMINIYNTTKNCFGDYYSLQINYVEDVTARKPLCVEREITEQGGVEFSKRLICIPRYCGDYSELDISQVCNGRGVCITNDQCDCDDGYTGQYCEDYQCNGIYYYEEEDVCSGEGECVSPDECSCRESYYGSECENMNNTTKKVLEWVAIVSSIAGFILLIGFCVYVCCGCGLCTFISFVCCCCVVNLSSIGSYSLFQKSKLNRYEQLEDFDILLSEQLLIKDETKAHVQINQQLFEIDYDEVKPNKIIGRGGSDAVVFLAKWKGSTVAFKCFHTNKLMSSQDDFNQFEAEVNLLVNVRHPNIIRAFGATLKPPRVGIVMEYCENGEILDFLKKYKKENNEDYPISSRIRMCREVISAIEYIHSRSIIHRDIKPENILIDSNENCKLMDFGISRVIKRTEGEELKTKRIGTSIYMAPELLSGEYDEKVDSFSFAIFLWVIFSLNQDPYRGQDLSRIEFLVASNPNLRPSLERLGEIYSDEKFKWLVDVMVRGWGVDPKERYSFVEMRDIFKENHKNT